jgi:hypothetical protein
MGAPSCARWYYLPVGLSSKYLQPGASHTSALKADRRLRLTPLTSCVCHTPDQAQEVVEWHVPNDALRLCAPVAAALDFCRLATRREGEAPWMAALFDALPWPGGGLPRADEANGADVEPCQVPLGAFTVARRPSVGCEGVEMTTAGLVGCRGRRGAAGRLGIGSVTLDATQPSSRGHLGGITALCCLGALAVGPSPAAPLLPHCRPARPPQVFPALTAGLAAAFADDHTSRVGVCGFEQAMVLGASLRVLDASWRAQKRRFGAWTAAQEAAFDEAAGRPYENEASALLHAGPAGTGLRGLGAALRAMAGRMEGAADVAAQPVCFEVRREGRSSRGV